MCGICGTLNFHSPADPSLIHEMVGSLQHRGPDGTGVHTDNEIGLGHARLSIIDIAGGSQPMHNEDKSLWIVFNGEIFNYLELSESLRKKGHRFATRSDTEVILHAYEEEGEACVQRFNGQWAFAIWDSTKRKLFLSRDRLGVRPLFYTQTNNGFLFASEIKALLRSPDVHFELDLQALDQIFTFWVTVPPRTAFRNIYQLPPGHSMVVQDREVNIHPYWRLEYAPELNLDDNAEERLSDELFHLLLDATTIRLRSDVPVGAYLSGGLDSTFVTALAKSAVGERLKTFSVSFEDSEFDESAYQHEASRFLGTQHSEVRCSNQDIAHVFPDVVLHAEQPILRCAPAPLYLLSRLVHNEGFKVVLTGEGADEVLGGYDIFKEAKIRRFWANKPQSSWRPHLLKRLYPYMQGMQRQPPSYLKRFFRVNGQDLKSPFFSHLPRWDLTSKLKEFLSAPVRACIATSFAMEDLEQELPGCYRSWDTFNQAEYLEARYLLPGYILSSQGDRMAMAHSVEGRYPFLDHRVVEFASRLPPTLKMKVLNEKHLLKRAAAGSVPESIRRRGKQPYRAPDGKCFLEHSEPYVMEMLSETRIKRDGIFDPQMVAGLVRKFQSGRETSTRDNMALVGILSTGLLIEHFT